jgi:hypothetical protein
MAPLQTKLKSLVTSSFLNSNDEPEFYRTDSASPFASDSSCDGFSPDMELQPWRYSRRECDSEQDEVRRKRRELAEKRRRASDAAWREFWG